MNIIMMGPQGSGKGTQARRLAADFNLELVEMGSILRKLQEEDSQRGRKAKELMNAGRYVPSSIVHEALGEFLDTVSDAKGLIFDAVPRRKKQLEFLDNYFKEKEQEIDVVLLLQIPEKITLERLSGRVISKRTGKIYNMHSKPPGKDERQEDLYQRPDDTKEAILSRLHEDKKHTQPVVTEYRKRGLVVPVDATESIDAVYDTIIQKLKSRGLV